MPEKSQGIRYRLSGRQRKEIANGKLLRIALPYPDQGIPGAQVHHDLSGAAPEAALIRWVEQVLEVGVPHDIVYADILTVGVDPLVHSSGLAAVLGQIVNDRQPRWTVRILVVAVEIVPAHRAERGVYPTQWPGSVELPDGRELP